MFQTKDTKKSLVDKIIVYFGYPKNEYCHRESCGIDGDHLRAAKNY